MLKIDEDTIKLWLQDKGFADEDGAIVDYCLREGLGDMRSVVGEGGETTEEQIDCYPRIGMRTRLLRGVRIEERMNEGIALGRKVFGDDNYQRLILGEKILTELARELGLDLKTINI